MKITTIILMLLISLAFSGCVYEDLEFDESDFDQALVTYTYTAANAGDVITVGTTDYNVFKVPVFDSFGANTYHVTFLSTSNVGAINVRASRLNEIPITPNQYAPGELLTIDGYSGLIHMDCVSSLFLTTQSYSCSTTLYIKVDDILLPIEVSGASESTNIDLGGISDFDYTDNVGTQTLTPYNPVPHIDDFIDYMRIEKIAL